MKNFFNDHQIRTGRRLASNGPFFANSAIMEKIVPGHRPKVAVLLTVFALFCLILSHTSAAEADETGLRDFVCKVRMAHLGETGIKEGKSVFFKETMGDLEIKYSMMSLSIDDKNYPEFVITAWLDDDGALESTIHIKVTPPGSKTPIRSPNLRGKEIYDTIIDFFEKDNITYISSHWFSGEEIWSDNLIAINTLLNQQGVNLSAYNKNLNSDNKRLNKLVEKFALQTWSGQQASRYGYRRAKVDLIRVERGIITKLFVNFYPGEG